jgi:meso-butanediol dehydrogenase/(S,S)-butanediol dehydrogenase/diacetyl reductase
MNNRFEGRVALVTGAASGIGAATARRLVREGARVWLADRDSAGVAAVAAELGEAAGSQELDVRDREAVAAFTEAAAARFGRIDVVVNNAGIGSFGPSDVLDPDTWRDVLATDLDSVFYGTRAALPHLRAAGGGAIVNTASISGLAGDYGFAAYNAAKGAVVNYTRTAALDHGHEHIRVNCVCPGPIHTGLTSFARDMPALVEAWERSVPLGRIGAADEVAAAIAFLASDDASYISGAALVVDGGLTAGTGQPNFTRIFSGT